MAILLVLVLLLLLQAGLALELQRGGHGGDHALALARLATLPLLLALVLCLLRKQRRFIRTRLSPAALTPRILFTGIATGCLLRIAGWSQVTLRGAFGQLDAALDAPPVAFAVGLACPSVPVLATAAVAWIVLVPLTEEVIHRGVVQSWFARYGKWTAVVTSTLAFTALHEPPADPWVATIGLVFAIQYWNSRFLWLPLVTHASYDGLVLIDELCLELTWNPPRETLPALVPGSIAAVTFLLAIAAVTSLLRARWVEPPPRRPDPASTVSS